jgi:hypothetical protein
MKSMRQIIPPSWRSAIGRRSLADVGREATPGRISMSLRKSLFMAFAMVVTTSVAPAAEAVWPKNSASDLAEFVTMLRFRIYADHCSAKVPQLEPEFGSLVENLNRRIQGISKGLLASDVFKGMKDKPVPAEIIDAFKDSFDDAKHNFERLDAASICPKTLQSVGEMDDESLKSGLTQVLTAVQNMTRKMERDGVRQASPETSPPRSVTPEVSDRGR